MDFAATPFQLKTLDESGFIAGLGAGVGDTDLGGDRLLYGAFAKTLAGRGGAPVPMLLHHDLKRPIGAWTKLTETPAGLEVEGKLTLATVDAREAYALAKDGALGGLSIGYDVQRHAHKGNVRELHEVGLHEVSLVSVPMHPRARVGRVKAITGVDDLRDLLRDECGLSARRAKLAAGAAWKAMNDTDDEAAAEAELASLFAASAARINAPSMRWNDHDNRF